MLRPPGGSGWRRPPCILTSICLDGARAGLDAAARERADRLARATTGQMEAALALLSMLDPEAFEIAFTAVPIASDDGDDEPIPVCRECGGSAGIFPDHGLRWQHFRGDGTTSGAQQIYEAGHAYLIPANSLANATVPTRVGLLVWLSSPSAFLTIWYRT
jgi:hypothetical protein